MLRSSLASLVLTLSVVMSAGVVGEQTASACPVQPPAPAHAALSRRHVRVARRAVPTPASSVAGSAEAYNLARVNEYRRASGLGPLALDASLTSFARAGSAQLMNDHAPHGHFRNAGDAMWHQGFNGNAAENQGSPTGWPRAASDPTQNEQRQIDQILASMMSEGPNGGHYRNMMSAKAKRIGIGLVEDNAGLLYLTNDFSE